jgi:hypothetical protein
MLINFKHVNSATDRDNIYQVIIVHQVCRWDIIQFYKKTSPALNQGRIVLDTLGGITLDIRNVHLQLLDYLLADLVASSEVDGLQPLGLVWV